jgi:hypothetical protein
MDHILKRGGGILRSTNLGTMFPPRFKGHWAPPASDVANPSLGEKLQRCCQIFISTTNDVARSRKLVTVTYLQNLLVN